MCLPAKPPKIDPAEISSTVLKSTLVLARRCFTVELQLMAKTDTEEIKLMTSVVSSTSRVSSGLIITPEPPPKKAPMPEARKIIMP